MEIDARGVRYRRLNEVIREAVARGETEIDLLNVNGHRYIADGLRERVTIVIHGVPGNDLGAFMNGPTVVVRSNVQDGVGNTMNGGKIVVHGHAGDVLGYGMRGGKIFVRDGIGYRVGIHMKAYQDQIPIIVAGGCAGDFLGEYMAGGVLIVLGLRTEPGSAVAGDYLGTGMHGGVMYLRGPVAQDQLGVEVGVERPDERDRTLLGSILAEYCNEFGFDREKLFQRDFVKLLPVSSSPYGRLYAH